jgi:hypothetical protein
MKRLLSAILALALGLGSVPAQAQVALSRVSLPAGMSAPTPVPSGMVPIAGSFAPSLSAPALSVSLTPAPYAPLVPLPIQPLKTAAVQGLPAAPFVTPARGETPLETLRTLAAPAVEQHANAIFDASLTRSAATPVEPSVEPTPEAKPRRNFLQRYRDGRGKNPLQNAFGKAMFFTTIGATAVPVLWGMAPSLKFAYAFAFADALMLAILIPLTLSIAVWRKLKTTPATASKPPPSRRAKIAVVVAGVLLGIGLSVAPYHATGPVVEQVTAYRDQSRTAAEKEHSAWIRGGAAEDETIKVLSQNPVGRDILDKLRDRGGVIRLPTFFISQQGDSYAKHEDMFDGVYLNAGELAQRGWTKEQFLKDPALQRRLVREMSSTVLHELVHAVQGRRPPWTPGQFKSTIECEQEAFFQEMLYGLARLEGDPAARNNGHDQWMVPDAAANLDGFLKSVAEMYPDNTAIGNDPYFNALMAEQHARWPAFRVHIYQVLAARAHTPISAKMYMDKAKAAAKEAGLPEPVELVASR